MTGFNLTRHKREVRSVARLHGHQMGRWLSYPHRPHPEQTCHCLRCGFEVRLNPDSGDYRGRAVELSCEAVLEPRPLVLRPSQLPQSLWGH